MSTIFKTPSIDNLVAEIQDDFTLFRKAQPIKNKACNSLPGLKGT